jgi:Rrf2 family cysteine metabolism transcriptional repressor
MKLSSRSRHGLRGVLELALNYGQGPMQIQTIAEKAGISNKYLEQLIAALKIGGFVRSTRGPKGGYFLAKKPAEITLGEVFTSLEGPAYNIDCAKHARFSKGCNECVTKHIWAKMQKATLAFIDSTTLQDLVDMAEGKKKP